MEFVANLRPHQFKLVKHAASQIVGRKAKHHTHNYQIPREEQIRSHQSPFKDLADSSQHEFVNYLKEDGHQDDHLFHAFADTIHVMHKAVRSHKGGSLTSHLNKIKNTLGNLANTARVNIDVTADDFLHKVGLRQNRKYQSKEIPDVYREHARLHKDVYKAASERKGTDAFDYVAEDSTERVGVYKHKQNGKAVVVLRGTRPKSSLLNNDIINDLHIAAGQIGNTEQIGDHARLIQKQIEKYGSGNVSLSGYSMGGAEAVHLTQDKRLRSHLGQTIALAPGHSPLDDMHKMKARDHKISYIYGHNDAVANSLLEHSGANHHVLYDESDPLKSHLLLDRLAG